MNIAEIINLAVAGEITSEEAANQIKIIFGAVVDGAAIGIGSFDATDMHCEIKEAIEEI